MSEFLLGAASSIFAAFLIYISRSLWVNWWHVLLSKNYPTVEGRYKIVERVPPEVITPWYPNEKQFIRIKQYGKKLSGKFEVYDNEKLMHELPLNGTVGTDRSLLLNYESDDPSYTLKGALLVRFKGVGGKIKGNHIFICLRCEKIHEFPVLLEKVT